MTLQDILRHKGDKVHTISPEATLEEVVDKLVGHNCGSLVVCDPTIRDRCRLHGIITERDILRASAAHRGRLDKVLVKDVMTTEVICGSPSDTVEDTMGLMTDHRIRHLPVVEGGELMGLISIGDIVKSQHDALSMENHYLKNYIHG